MTGSLASSSKEDRAALSSSLDRETRRERTLELLDRENRLRWLHLLAGCCNVMSREKNRKSLRTAFTLVKGMGLNKFRATAHQQTQADKETQDSIKQAELKFFASIKQEREKRLNTGKPLSFKEEF